MNVWRAVSTSWMLFLLSVATSAAPLNQTATDLSNADSQKAQEIVKSQQLTEHSNRRVRVVAKEFLKDPSNQESKEKLISTLNSERLFSEPESSLQKNAGNATDVVKDLRRDGLYREEKQTRERNFVGRKVDDFNEWLNEMMRRRSSEASDRMQQSFPTGNIAGLSQIVVNVVLGILGVAAVGLLIYFFLNRGSKAAKPSDGILAEEEEIATSIEWHNRAAEFAQDSDYRQAVRSQYIAVLILLDEEEALDFERTQTNWEHVRRFPRLGYDGPLKVLNLNLPTLLFDRIWYGGEVASAQNYHNLKDLFESIRSKEVQAV